MPEKTPGFGEPPPDTPRALEAPGGPLVLTWRPLEAPTPEASEALEAVTPLKGLEAPWRPKPNRPMPEKGFPHFWRPSRRPSGGVLAPGCSKSASEGLEARGPPKNGSCLEKRVRSSEGPRRWGPSRPLEAPGGPGP